MSVLLQAGAIACALLAALAAAAVLLRQRDARLAVRVLMDLLLAALLLRLSADAGWPWLLVAAVVVAVRPALRPA